MRLYSATARGRPFTVPACRRSSRPSQCPGRFEPSSVPRSLAIAKASLVRVAIARASCSAITASRSMVRSLAFSLSQQMNLCFDSLRVRVK